MESALDLIVGNPWVWLVGVVALALFLRAFVRGGRMLERFAEREAERRAAVERAAAGGAEAPGEGRG